MSIFRKALATSEAILRMAYRIHKNHVFCLKGSNFVECQECRKHFTAIDGERVYVHWRSADSYDRTPITSLDDPRI
jgi:hypothetical protein